MENLAFQTDRATTEDDGAVTLRNIVIVNGVILAVGLLLAAAAPKQGEGSAARTGGVAQDGVAARSSHRY